MAKVSNPTTLSQHLDIEPSVLEGLGILNPTLAIDTKLFIDPLLFSQCAHQEISVGAVASYRTYFETVIKFLQLTLTKDDVAWRSAYRLLRIHEIQGNCLGYGANSIDGNAFGPILTERIMRVGKEIVGLGILEPDLFSAMALFESDIGPDRISDLAMKSALPAFVNFNERILGELGIQGEKFTIQGVDGTFIQNPFHEKPIPVILIPLDILRELPIARDWDQVATAARKNQEIRDRVNIHIGEIWKAKTKRDKRKLRDQVLNSRDAFQALLDSIHEVSLTPYDSRNDPSGQLTWARAGAEFAAKHPLTLIVDPRASKSELLQVVVQQILDRYQYLIEERGLNKELYDAKGSPRHESSAQRLLFAIAYSYCEANNLGIIPEYELGNGTVDFRFAFGFKPGVLVEVKLSTNAKLVKGYTTQLEVYKSAEPEDRAIYIVLDVGRMGKKRKTLEMIRNETILNNERASDLIFVDGIIYPTASKR